MALNRFMPLIVLGGLVALRCLVPALPLAAQEKPVPAVTYLGYLDRAAVDAADVPADVKANTEAQKADADAARQDGIRSTTVGRATEPIDTGSRAVARGVRNVFTNGKLDEGKLQGLVESYRSEGTNVVIAFEKSGDGTVAREAERGIKQAIDGLRGHGLQPSGDVVIFSIEGGSDKFVWLKGFASRRSAMNLMAIRAVGEGNDRVYDLDTAVGKRNNGAGYAGIWLDVATAYTRSGKQPSTFGDGKPVAPPAR